MSSFPSTFQWGRSGDDESSECGITTIVEAQLAGCSHTERCDNDSDLDHSLPLSPGGW
ncbi:TPA: hypothetical protein PRX67_004303 [Escherichia coli]|uniref:hypothetical protein n=1 Tax=Enterobacteriaceae TaxID=543 RepID=UPI00145B9F22|nr:MULTISPECIES: hypothetical protein [Enterobacteriaceae]EHH8709861.1 hypothetical protein [Escherichia coli]EHN7805541.1 hypothetical protein [Escherichia coli]EHO3206372.1 hypothetical protein [Escherichia coli]EKG7014882.1 hypothetical protein [Escherichia coli]EKL6597742.1 hypothetical protein [Escherichia coli]